LQIQELRFHNNGTIPAGPRQWAFRPPGRAERAVDLLSSLAASLLSPMVLAFGLGLVAAAVRSDLRFPEGLSTGLTLYLLLAIGLKGGARLEGVDPAEFWAPLLAGVALCLAIPFWSYAVLLRLGRLRAVDAAAVAAHYGSVSVVTFSAALVFLDGLGVAHEPFLPALLAIMEVPAILVGIYLGRRAAPPAPDLEPGSGGVLRELFTGKSAILLGGGLAIGWLSGGAGYAQVAPLFDAPFRGVLTLFLLDVGMVTGRRVGDLRRSGAFVGAFAVLMPLLHGALGVVLGGVAGLGVGGATVLGTLAASASYIAAPAAVRVALPEASPALYLAPPLAVTFPFNVVIGIPLYYALATRLLGS
jgi:uncharacterized protein